MAEEKKGEKTIEMRLAELEDKLSKIHVTEDEIKAYQKVSSMLGTPGGAVEEAAMPSAVSPVVCTIYQCIVPRHVSRLINRGITPRINRGINECNECGPCAGGGGVGGAGGFGGFGM